MQFSPILVSGSVTAQKKALFAKYIITQRIPTKLFFNILDPPLLNEHDYHHVDKHKHTMCSEIL